MQSGPPGVAAAYDASLGRLCAGAVGAVLDAVATAHPGAGPLLDAGCGTGSLAVAAVTAGHSVVGVDADQGMIGFARAQRGVAGVEYLVGSMMQLEFPDAAFDAAVANFAVNHTIDPVASLRELARVVRQGGPVVATIWPHRVSALNRIWTEVVARSGAVRPSLPPLTPGQRFERTTRGLVDLMSAAGLCGATGREITWSFDIAPEDLWLTASAGLALIGPVYLAQDIAMRRRMQDAYADVTAELAVDGLLHLPMTAVLATATSPSR